MEGYSSGPCLGRLELLMKESLIEEADSGRLRCRMGRDTWCPP
mgnify:CR=1 FL=1